jgi:hypothetical protein
MAKYGDEMKLAKARHQRERKAEIMPAWLVSMLPGTLGRLFDFADGWQERRSAEAQAKHEARFMQIQVA